jgi:hypothetical protein
VRCAGAVPSLLTALGNLLWLEVIGRAVKEGRDPAAAMPGRRRVRLAVQDQSVDVTDLRLAYAPAGADCDADGYSPTLAPGEEFSVCVTVTVRIPIRGRSGCWCAPSSPTFPSLTLCFRGWVTPSPSSVTCWTG